MGLFKFSVKRPIAVTMIILIVILLGAVSFSKLGLALLPDMDLPMLLLTASYSGAGPEEVEEQLTTLLEGAVNTISGVDTITSYSMRDNSLILIQFVWGTDLNEATNSIRDRLELYENYMPTGVGSITIVKMDPNSLPIMSLEVSGTGTLDELTEYAKETVEPALSRIGGVASVSISGGVEEEYRITISPQKLSAYGVSTAQIMQLLYQENSNTGAGTLDDGGTEYSLRIVGQFESIEDIENLPVTTMYGGTINLSNLATVERVPKEQSSYVYINGNPGLSLSIMQASDANIVSTSNKVREVLEDLVDESNDKYHVRVFYDQADFINLALRNVTESGIVGGALAIIILLVFLRNIKSTLIIGVSIPVSIISTFAMMYFAEINLNMLSLGGLTLGIGMMVDNSIVLLESIYRLREEGMSRIDAALEGSREVAGAVIASTVTTVVVFLPIVFVEGMAAQIFRPMALTICFSLLASLASAFLVVPMMSTKFMEVIEPSEKFSYKVGEKFNNLFLSLRAKYEKLLNWSINNKKKVIFITIALIAGSLCLIPFIGTEFIPSTKTNSYTVDISLPAGTTLDESLKIGSMAEELLWEIPENEEVMYSVGGGSGTFMSSLASTGSGSISFTATLKDGAYKSIDEVLDRVRTGLSVIPDAEISVAAQSIMMISMDTASVSIEGDDFDQLKDFSEVVADEFKKVEGTREVETTFTDGSPELQISVDRNKASSFGLNSYTVAATVAMIMNGTTATQVNESGDKIDVRIVVGDEYKEDLNALSSLTIGSTTGNLVPLSEIATFSYSTSPNTIIRNNQSRQATISCSVSGRALGDVTSDIKDRLSKLNIPTGVTLNYDGIYQTMMDSFKDLGLALILAVILVYMVMAFQFENLLYPFIIMFSMPPMFIGVLLGLFLTGRTINVVTIIGVIMLAGIVVNNAIVLVEYINFLREDKNMTALEAVKKACPTRLRPIMMTTLTTVLAMIPMAIGFGEGAELMTPLATSVAAGLTFSTLITLVFVPVLYLSFDKKKKEN